MLGWVKVGSTPPSTQDADAGSSPPKDDECHF